MDWSSLRSIRIVFWILILHKSRSSRVYSSSVCCYQLVVFSIMLLSRLSSSNRSRNQYRHYSCYMQLSFFWWLPWTSIWIGLGPNQYLFRNKRTSNILSLFSLDCCCSWCWCSWPAYSSYWISIDGCSWTSDMGLR